MIACISSAPRTESLQDGVFCMAAHITKSTVAQGFADFYDNRRSRAKVKGDMPSGSPVLL